MTGQYVKNKIRQAGVPLSEVARRLNITPQSLTHRLGVEDMKVSALIEVATAIDKELAYFVEGYDPTLVGDNESVDLQHKTGQIFKQHVEVAHCNSRKGKDSLTMNAAVADYTRLQYIQKLLV